MTLRAVLLLGAYLLVFPLFVLGPLAGLLLASRPQTLREWLWIGFALVWAALSLLTPEGIATQTLEAWAFFVTGAFVLLMLTGRRGVVPGAFLASLFGFGAVTAWSWSLGTRWRDIQLAVEHGGWEMCRQLVDSARAAGAARAQSVEALVDAMAAGVSLSADLFPALLVLTALPGLALAWSWYHRLASRPVGKPAEAFAEFRFSDQLVWLIVLALAAWLLPLPPLLGGITDNLAVLAGGLYAARGAAILWGSLETFPLLVLLLILVGALTILPVAMGGCFAIGLADTWVDFRRRYASADTEGRDPWK